MIDSDDNKEDSFNNTSTNTQQARRTINTDIKILIVAKLDCKFACDGLIWTILPWI